MDMLFGLVLLGVIAFVSWVGYLAYHEGLKIETSKRQGEAWLQWLGEASATRFQPDFSIPACAGGVPAAAAEASAAAPEASVAEAATVPLPPPAAAAASAAPKTWGACFKALTQEGGPWAGQTNPFAESPVRLVPKCDKNDLSVAGHFFFEKLTPTPPGSPVPTLVSALGDADLLDQKLQLRLTVCDKGGLPMRIGEVEF